MTPIRLVATAARSLANHKLRTFLSSLGVVFGVLALVAMLSVAEGAKRETLNQIELLGTDNLILRRTALSAQQVSAARERLSLGLSTADARLIEATVPGVRVAAPLSLVEAELADLEAELSPEVICTTGAYLTAKGLPLESGRSLCDSDLSSRRLVCVLGAEVAAALGARGRVGARVRIAEQLFEVVGVLAPRAWSSGRTPALTARNSNQAVFLPLGTEALLGATSRSAPAGELALDEISVQLAGGADVTAAARVLARTLDLSHRGVVDYQLVVPHELLASAYRTQRVFNLVLGSVALLSLLVGGIGIMNILLASVSERTQEIGLRRAVGADRLQILAQFLAEALLLSVGGGLVGLAAGNLAARSLSSLAGWSTVMTPWAALLALGMALVVGVAAGLYPAVRAAWLDPIRALRHA